MTEKRVQRQTYNRTCQQCHAPFVSRRAHAAYCSDACRAKASRAAHGAIVDDQRAASVRRNATKAAQHFERTCPVCGQPFSANGKQGRRLYCGSRCKKRAFYAAHRPSAGRRQIRDRRLAITTSNSGGMLK